MYSDMCMFTPPPHPRPPRKSLPPFSLKIPLETWHVLKPIEFFKLTFVSPNFPMGKIRGKGGFHLLFDTQLNRGAGISINSSLYILPTVCCRFSQ